MHAPDMTTLAVWRVQLGSGRKPKPGWLTVDISAAHTPDLVADLGAMWPFKDNAVTEYEIEHVLEHLPEPAHVVCEAHRTLVPGGCVELTIPHAKSPFAVADPTHVRFFNGLSMDYYATEGGARRLAGTYEHDLRLFEMVERRYVLGGAFGVPLWRLLGIEALARRFPVAFEKWWSWFPFGGCDVVWVLRKPVGA